MQIHIVVKTEKPQDEWINTNVTPFLSKAKADGLASELNEKRTSYDLMDYLEYVVETLEIAA